MYIPVTDGGGTVAGDTERPEVGVKVARGEGVADPAGVELTAAEIEATNTVGDDAGGQGDIGGQDQVARLGALGDPVVGGVDIAGNNDQLHSIRCPQVRVSDDREVDVVAVRDLVDLLLDRAGVGVKIDSQCASRPRVGVAPKDGFTTNPAPRTRAFRAYQREPWVYEPGLSGRSSCFRHRGMHGVRAIHRVSPTEDSLASSHSLAALLLADCPDHLAMMPRTTRERLFREARSRWIKTNPKGRWRGLFAGAGQASKHASLQASTDDHLPLSVPHASPF